MKNFFTLLVISSAILFYSGCSTNLDNQVRFNNLSAGDIRINFRAEIIDVPSSQEVIIKNVTPGTYTYATTYEVPASATSSSEQGDVSGQIVIRAGTKVTVLYSSTFFNGIYTIFATKTSSDDESFGGDGP